MKGLIYDGPLHSNCARRPGRRRRGLRELLAKLAPVDLVIFKRTMPIKIELHRPSLGKPLLCPDNPAVVAVASDVPVPLVECRKSGAGRYRNDR